jgi:hypothetical protein
MPIRPPENRQLVLGLVAAAERAPEAFTRLFAPMLA